MAGKTEKETKTYIIYSIVLFLIPALIYVGYSTAIIEKLAVVTMTICGLPIAVGSAKLFAIRYNHS